VKHVKGKGHHAEHTIVFMLMYVYTSLVAEDVKLIGSGGHHETNIELSNDKNILISQEKMIAQFYHCNHFR